MVRSARDDASVAALDDQRRALVVAYTSHLLLRSHRSELTMAESSAIARCTTLAEAMHVIESRRTPILAGVRDFEPGPDGTARRPLGRLRQMLNAVMDRVRSTLIPLVRLLRQAIPYFPIMWIAR